MALAPELVPQREFVAIESPLVNYLLADTMKGVLRINAQYLAGRGVDLARLSKRLTTYDDAMMRALEEDYGFESGSEYYRAASATSALAKARVPTLCILALDDPILCPQGVVEVLRATRENDNVVTVVTSHGGHLGWCDSLGGRWSERLVREFVEAVLEPSLHGRDASGGDEGARESICPGRASSAAPTT